jgi:predicted DNA-binding transcriptional regulator AlpA
MTQQATEAPPEKLVTVGNACGQLGIGKTTFYRLVRQGVFTTYNLNADAPRGPIRKGQKRPMIRVDQAEVDAYKISSRIPATA